MHTFYAANLNDEVYELSGSEALHALKVLRLKTGDTVRLADGNGKYCEAEIIETHQKTCDLRLGKCRTEKRKKYSIEIAIAPPKTASRLEFMLEKLTETGVDRIILFESEYSERRKVNTDRLKKILVAGMKQSHNYYMPELIAMPSFTKIINQNFDGVRMIAHCLENRNRESIKKVLNPDENLQILIGPEGDFSLGEIQTAVSQGFREISLTNLRLRTETAAIYAAIAADFSQQSLKL